MRRENSNIYSLLYRLASLEILWAHVSKAQLNELYNLPINIRTREITSDFPGTFPRSRKRESHDYTLEHAKQMHTRTRDQTQQVYICMYIQLIASTRHGDIYQHRYTGWCLPRALRVI